MGAPEPGRQSDEAMLERLRAVIDVKDSEPGVALGAIRDGKVVLRGCKGRASLEHGVAIGPRTRFHVVSVTKTFTAAAIAALVARGEVALDDAVERFIPELPAAHGTALTHALTLRHLLSMTSGLYDSLELERLRGVWRPSPDRERDLLDLLLAQDQRSFAPGAQYAYCNANFVLLDEVIRRVTGLEPDEVRSREIYAALGLERTGRRSHDGVVLADLAEGYVNDPEGGWRRGTDLLGISGDVVTSTLDDMLVWLLALAGGNVAGVPVTAAMATRAALTSGGHAYYGLGLAVRRYRGLTVLCHSGSQPGYKAHLCYVPERHVGFVLLANREDVRPTAIAEAALEALVDDFPASHPSSRVLAHDEGTTVLAGEFLDLTGGEWLSLSNRDGVLAVETLGDPASLYPDGAGAYADADDYRAHFPMRLRPDSRASDRLDVSLAGRTCRFDRCVDPRYTLDDLAVFAGIYEHERARIIHRVHLDEAGLRVTYGGWFDRSRTFPMRAIHRDTFLVEATGPGVAHRHLFRFERGSSGEVRSVVLTMERLKGLRMERVCA
jgi:CubicO group peptidase (beta-lactamase class C family)